MRFRLLGKVTPIKVSIPAMLVLMCGCFQPLFAQSANPVPYLNQPVLPDSVAPGGPGFTLTVTGSAFVSGAKVNWNGSPRATTFVSATQLTATILASDIAHASTATITVTNPSPGGGTSNFQFLSITSPVPSPAFARLDQSLGYNIGEYASSPVIADFNGDGIPDVAMPVFDSTGCLECEIASESICILLGVGDGTFQPPNCFIVDKGFTYGGGLVQVALQAADMNGDGKIDLVYLAVTGTLDVLLGNGDGTFQAPIKTLPTSGGLYLISAIADFNHDGELDVMVWDGSDLVEYLGNGDGTFAASAVVSTGGLSVGPPISGDFNRDGNLDFAFVSDSGLFLLLGNGDGTFQSPQMISSVQAGFQLLAGDFNNDGNLDLMEEIQASTAGGSIPILVFLGNGDGTFQASKSSSTSAYVAQLADMNGDGILDLVGAETNVVTVQLGNGDGTFNAPLSFPVPSNASSNILVGDFNRDGMMDILSVDQGDTLYSQLASITLSVDIQGVFPHVEFSPSPLSIFPVGLGGSTTAPVILTNTGSATLNISGISITGAPYDNELTQTNTCGSSVAAGASCTITITFNSLGGGNINANLLVADNAPGGPQALAITTTSPDFTISSNNSSTFTFNPGESATYGITVSALYNFQGTVSLSCSGAPAESNCTVTPGSVAICQECPNPTANATVTITTTPNTSAISKPPAPLLPLNGFIIFALALALLLVFIPTNTPRHRKQVTGFIAIIFFNLGMISMSSCGGGGGGSGNGTPSGTYTITITGKIVVPGATLTHIKKLTLVVK